jgi:hypothetical protein
MKRCFQGRRRQERRQHFFAFRAEFVSHKKRRYNNLKRFAYSVLILAALVIIPMTGMAADVNVNVQIGAQPAEAPVQELPAEEYIPEGDPTPPPPLAVREPELVVVPSGEAQVYMVPNTVGVYFYGGTWYRYHHGVWFSTGVYNAPWVVVGTPLVPSFVVGISPAYALYLPPSYHRIRYGEFHSHWRTWDRERRWERESWYKNERRAEVRQARERQARERVQRDRRERTERVKADKVGYKKRLADPGRYNKTDKTGSTTKTGVTKTGVTKTGVTKDGVTKTGVTKTGVTKTGVTKDGVTKTGVTKTGVTKTGVTKDGVTKTGVTKTGVTKTGVTKTGVTKTGVTKTGVTKTGVTKTGVTKTGVTKTGVTKTGVTKTGVTKTGVTKTGVTKANVTKASPQAKPQVKDTKHTK